jgi:DNA-directed RNA polymerase specialized sigma24 family protein
MRSEIEQAVQLLQTGDDAALEQALALLQNTVFSFSMRVCGQRQDAEDTMQEVLLESVPHLPKFDSPKALVVWLYKVAKNRCLMSRRRSKFAPNPDASLLPLGGGTRADRGCAASAVGEDGEGGVGIRPIRPPRKPEFVMNCAYHWA